MSSEEYPARTTQDLSPKGRNSASRRATRHSTDAKWETDNQTDTISSRSDLNYPTSNRSNETLSPQGGSAWDFYSGESNEHLENPSYQWGSQGTYAYGLENSDSSTGYFGSMPGGYEYPQETQHGYANQLSQPDYNAQPTDFESTLERQTRGESTKYLFPILVAGILILVGILASFA